MRPAGEKDHEEMNCVRKGSWKGLISL